MVTLQKYKQRYDEREFETAYYLSVLLAVVCLPWLV